MAVLDYTVFAFLQLLKICWKLGVLKKEKRDWKQTVFETFQKRSICSSVLPNWRANIGPFLSYNDWFLVWKLFELIDHFPTEKKDHGLFLLNCLIKSFVINVIIDSRVAPLPWVILLNKTNNRWKGLASRAKVWIPDLKLSNMWRNEPPHQVWFPWSCLCACQCL